MKTDLKSNKKILCNLFMEPPALNEYSTFDFDKIKELVAIGYNYDMDHQKDVLKLK